MNRTHFQQLAEIRLREAEALLAAGLWDGAYYLAGYMIECGLKACILARVEREGVIFAEGQKKFSERCWIHDLSELLDLAGLKDTLEAAMNADPDLRPYWNTVKDWKETKRYARTPEAQARDLLTAVTDPVHGVWPWIRTQL